MCRHNSQSVLNWNGQKGDLKWTKSFSPGWSIYTIYKKEIFTVILRMYIDIYASWKSVLRSSKNALFSQWRHLHWTENWIWTAFKTNCLYVSSNKTTTCQHQSQAPFPLDSRPTNIWLSSSVGPTGFHRLPLWTAVMETPGWGASAMPSDTLCNVYIANTNLIWIQDVFYPL